ncbi:MAG: 2-amino-4-hydroxy-6-hydroxymethyldihydropteridine diphosphokinase [Bacteroidetes bacterium]|nr:2-amino-4-hydroxy-6-hydroxymethyldihydropteridine diphosphokinase [Bacteroidota bacterium]MBS1591344.1 2-amino-4-hydroxy-6-hydroxymethyldihydropteridine diphosphokinase [Bacteroidota bacterium]
MQSAYLLIGGNLGNTEQNLQTAIDLINKQCGIIINKSSIYKTAAWGLTNQPDFLNQVLVLNTSLTAQNLMHELLLIEEKMGRVRSIKMGPRIIDIDILLFDDLILNTEILTVPHTALPQRKFALIPLAEVAGNIIHPVEKKSIQHLLLNCKDTLDVHKISPSA